MRIVDRTGAISRRLNPSSLQLEQELGTLVVEVGGRRNRRRRGRLLGDMGDRHRYSRQDMTLPQVEKRYSGNSYKDDM